MSDKVSRLCSRLRFASDDFRNLVSTDLSELKWKTFQMVCVGLFQLLPALSEESNKLQTYVARRQKELGIERAEGLTRSERVEAEQDHRTRLSRCILEGLEKLRWPPTQLAFSNPLQTLMEDYESKIDAVEYLLDIIQPRGGSTGLLGDDQHDKDSRRSSRGAETKIERHLEETSSGQTPRTPELIRPKPLPSYRNLETQSSARSCGAPHDLDMASHEPDGPAPFRKVSAEETDPISVKEALRTLQFQNEQLTQSLRAMTAAVMERDEAENQIEATLIELRTAVAELSDITTIDPKDKCMAQEGVVGKESTLNKNISNSLGDNRRGSAQGGAGPLWRSVQGRIDSLYKQWTDARKHCRDSATSKVHIHPFSASAFVVGGSNRRAISARLDRNLESASKVTTPASKRKQFSTSLDDEEMLTPLLDLSSISSIHSTSKLNSTRLSTARSVSSVGSKATTTRRLNSCSGDRVAFRQVDFASLRLYQVLGLSAPVSVLRKIEAAEGSDARTVELDRHRVFQLQRDLVNFAEKAFLVCCSDNFNSMDNIQSGVSSDNAVDDRAFENCLDGHKLFQLRSAAQNLLIRISCFAPLAPSNACFPMSSNISGLDAVIAEVSNLLISNKSARNGGKIDNGCLTVLERAMQRASSEQAALVQCLHFAEVHTKSCLERDRIKRVRLRDMLTKSLSVIDRCDSELKAAMEVVQTVIRDLRSAEVLRIEMPGAARVQNGTGANASYVNPLDVLSRGYLGAEVSALINSIRAFSDNFESIEMCLKSARHVVEKEIYGCLQSVLIGSAT